MALTGHEKMFCFDKTFVSIIIISFFFIYDFVVKLFSRFCLGF